jgi:tetratricopeptide (TPR) repeat protein
MRRVTFCLVVLLAAAGAAFAATAAPSPAWLLYEQGRTWADQGEFGKALQLYKEAILAAGVMPEAEAAIGDIYREEGETEMAVRQYARAYGLRNALAIPEQKYDILYRWAGLCEDQELYNEMESRLLLIIADDRWSTSEQLPVQVERNYVEKGLDHVLSLYRFDSWFATAAHSRLGWFYYRTGRYPQAIRHLLYAVILQVADASEFLRQKDADAVVDGLATFFSLVLRDREARSWLESSSICADLYYLAASSWELGHPLRAQATWKVLEGVKEAGKYADLSRRQLSWPFREPFLVPSFRLQSSP